MESTRSVTSLKRDSGDRVLKRIYKKGDMIYEMVKRTEDVAMFKNLNKNGQFIAYEVGKIKNSKGGEMNGIVFAAGESYWTDNDFGRIAWSIKDEKSAEDRYDLLIKKSLEKRKKEK